MGRGWAGARRPPQSLPQSNTRNPWPQGHEATDKYTNPLPTPTTWRGGGLRDLESKDKDQVVDTLGRPGKQMRQ